MEGFVIALLIIGMVLLVIEIVVPGFGIFGGLGIFAFIGAICLTFTLENALMYFLIEVAILVTFFVVSFYLMKKLNVMNRLVNDDKIDEEIRVDYSHLLNSVGVVKSAMRPVGFIVIANEQYEAISSLGYIDKGNEVKVTKVIERKIFVEKV
ncbi:MAG: NfeD family protein [Lachnospirales bacterium]